MDNLETQAPLDTRHRAKTNKTKKMSNSNTTTKTRGWTDVLANVIPVSYKTLSFQFTRYQSHVKMTVIDLHTFKSNVS